MDLMSTAQLLANFGEFVGAIAVVATLFYLAVQVRHSKEATEANTRSLQLQSYQTWQASNLEINMAMTNPAQAKMVAEGNRDSSNLTEDTFVGFGMMHMALMQMAQSTDYLYRHGSLDRELWESEMKRAAGILSVPGVRQWWDAGGKTQVTPRFAALIATIQPDIEYWNWNKEKGFVGGKAYDSSKSPDGSPML